MPPSYIRVRAVVWAYGRGQTDTQTDTQTHVTTIHFASSTTHAKCNKRPSVLVGDVERVVVQSDSSVDGRGLVQQRCTSTAVQRSHFHRRVVRQHPVYQLLWVQTHADEVKT